MENFQYGMEEIRQNGICKNHLPFHSIACPAYRFRFQTDSPKFASKLLVRW